MSDAKFVLAKVETHQGSKIYFYLKHLPMGWRTPHKEYTELQSLFLRKMILYKENTATTED